MPFAIASLSHPLAGYCLLVAAIAGCSYAALVRGAFVAGFTGAAAALLAALAHLAEPFDTAGMAVLGCGAALLNVEFRVSTYGAAGACGIGAAAFGSWLLLGDAAAYLSAAWRLVVAVMGATVLAAVVARAWRRRTLPE